VKAAAALLALVAFGALMAKAGFAEEVPPATGPAAPAATTTAPDTIQTKSGFFGTSYRYGGKKLKSGEDFRNTFRKVDDPEPARLYARSHRYEVASDLIGIPGGFLLGGDLGVRLRGDDGNTAVLVSGAGLVVLSGFFQAKSNHAKNHAVERFNTRAREDAPVSLRLQPPSGRGEWLRLTATF
jgi:hypothetical protein